MKTGFSWGALFNQMRTGDQSVVDNRSAFQRDYDRIIFSSPFRRLQSKTQVFPLPEADFIHTRMMHSLEVGSIGRSMGFLVREKLDALVPELNEKNITHSDFEGVCAAACLCHDIGNPPFGHSGETAIAHYFKTHPDHLEDLDDDKKHDFYTFDGNAMGFRLLTHTLEGRSLRMGGLGLTRASLGAFIKYPWTSKNATSKGKYNCFSGDNDVFDDIMSSLGLKSGTGKYFRHPLSFLVEASDDICYRVMDLEDGYRLGIVGFSEIENLFRKVIGESFDIKKYSLILEEKEKIAWLRAKTINILIESISDSFVKNYNLIMTGNFSASLIEIIKENKELEDILKIEKEKVYSYRKVIEIETAGFEIISGLIDAFIKAVLSNDSHSKKILQLLPKTYIYSKDLHDYKYNSIMNIVQYIAGMTDTFAVNTYKTIKGIELPKY
ncbi:MAG: dNTP triphosphohydrolase [Deltaproteobacteria bacterium]|nr:dNTP triphosphohydrolase [Deltaproteobacteria bacterium]